jgi:hypothetical protein
MQKFAVHRQKKAALRPPSLAPEAVNTGTYWKN